MARWTAVKSNMWKLLLQAAILAIHLPFIYGEGWIKNDTEAADQGGGGDWGTVNDMPAGFTIECTFENGTCGGRCCGWNGFNSCDKVMNNERFLCYLLEGQYSCVVANSIHDEDPFCNSSKQCGFQDGFQKGQCEITKTPGSDTDKGCSTNSPQVRIMHPAEPRPTNSGASTRTIGSWIAVIIIMVVGHSIYLCTQIPPCPGGQNSRAQSDEQNGGEDSGDITIPLQQQSPRSTDEFAPEPGN